MVSVILIFWNAERFLEEAIRSVFAQYDSDWEFLLVDDGSTDSSTDIALKWAHRHSDKVCYLTHAGRENRGMSASRNLGIRNARGDYVAFLDADDEWRPHTLAEQQQLLEAHPRAGCVYGATEWWYSWTGKKEDADRDFVQPLGVQADQLIEPPALLLTTLVYEAYNPAGILWRHSLLADIGGYEEQFRGMFEDQACYAKALITTPVYVSSKCWYRYRKHPDGACVTSVNSGRYIEDRSAFLKWLKGYLHERQFPHKELHRLINRELIRCRCPHLDKILACLAQKRQRLKEIVGALHSGELPARP